MAQHPFLQNLLNGQAVEWKPLGEVVNIKRGKRLVRSELEEAGEYAVYQNSLQPLGYYHQANCPSNSTFIITAGAAGEIGYSYDNFWAADDCYYLECPKDKLNDRFVYHALMNQKQKIVGQVRKASVPRLGRNSIENILIPIPPLSAQTKIVQILDTMTAITAELTAELAAELDMRNKQYQYYRDKLLTFDARAVQSLATASDSERQRATAGQWRGRLWVKLVLFACVSVFLKSRHHQMEISHFIKSELLEKPQMLSFRVNYLKNIEQNIITPKRAMC